MIRSSTVLACTTGARQRQREADQAEAERDRRRLVRKPVVATLPDGTEVVVVHPVGNLAMAWDHRAFDGAYAAGFLAAVKEILETKDWSTEL